MPNSIPDLISDDDIERSSRIANGVIAINKALEVIEEAEDRAQALRVAIKLHKLDPDMEKTVP